MTAKKAATAKKAKKPKHYTRAQNKSMRQYMRHHPSTHATRVAGRKAARVSARRGQPSIAPAVVEGYWLTGDNDTMPSCVPVALANAILAQTGRRASVSDLEALSVALGDAQGMFMPAALHAITEVECTPLTRRTPRWLRWKRN